MLFSTRRRSLNPRGGCIPHLSKQITGYLLLHLLQFEKQLSPLLQAHLLVLLLFDLAGIGYLLQFEQVGR